MNLDWECFSRRIEEITARFCMTRRERIATEAMKGLLARQESIAARGVAGCAVELADALIVELDKPAVPTMKGDAPCRTATVMDLGIVIPDRVLDAEGKPVFAPGHAAGRVLVVDLMPAANLSHPHLWVLMDPSTCSVAKTIIHGWPAGEARR